MLPKSLRPCLAPLARVSVLGTSSASARVSDGRPQRTQCTHVPPGASGSSQMRAMLFVPAGAADQLNGGDTSGPSPGYFFGIVAPAPKAELLISSAMVLPPFVASSPSRAREQPATAGAGGAPGDTGGGVA